MNILLAHVMHVKQVATAVLTCILQCNAKYLTIMQRKSYFNIIYKTTTSCAKKSIASLNCIY